MKYNGKGQNIKILAGSIGLTFVFKRNNTKQISFCFTVDDGMFQSKYR